MTTRFCSGVFVDGFAGAAAAAAAPRRGVEKSDVAAANEPCSPRSSPGASRRCAASPSPDAKAASTHDGRSA